MQSKIFSFLFAQSKISTSLFAQALTLASKGKYIDIALLKIVISTKRSEAIKLSNICRYRKQSLNRRFSSSIVEFLEEIAMLFMIIFCLKNLTLIFIVNK